MDWIEGKLGQNSGVLPQNIKSVGSKASWFSPEILIRVIQFWGHSAPFRWGNSSAGPLWVTGRVPRISPCSRVASNCNLTVKLSTSPHLSLGWESHPDQSKKVFFLWKLLGLENSHGNEHYPIFTWSYNRQGIKVYQPSSATSIPPLSQASCLHRRGYLLARQKNTQEIAWNTPA